MPIAPSADAPSEHDAIRREYESSLSWRITRPLRALGRRARAARLHHAGARASLGRGTHDSWLEHLHGGVLERIDAACAAGGPDRFALFRGLDEDLWALLLTQEYDVYPNIRALLPEVPEPSLQQLWNGANGVPLANQSRAFYGKLRERYAQASRRPLAKSRVLDFGCGWGRLTRFLARDVEPGALFGCDPVESILDVCRKSGVPATLARSELVPDRLPFDQRFDLVFAFSVFTHLSEPAHERCLRALHSAIAPGGILVVTIRPPEYLRHCELLHPLLRSLGADVRGRLERPGYFFVPHAAEPSHPLYAGGEMNYGETVVTLPYVRERWSPMFELLAVDVLIGDLFQVMLTLRR
jgi:SAM-dependent methyltransferase